jgi:hypothetical protein
VRIAYSPEGLYWRATGIDYYLWYEDDPQPADDLTHYDALAIYLDTDHDRATAPQSDDYYFLVSLHGDGPGEDTPQYRRQARGTGSGWNPSAISSAAWLDYSGWQWSDSGPNDNGGNIDFGWVMGGTIPWSVLGLSGPPAAGTVWGLGVLQYDQDQSLSSPTIQENWPETFNRNQPVTWGELHFGNASYQPPSAVREGTTTIRAATPLDNTVEDAWMGGGGWCYSGHEGHTEDNHGDDAALYVGSEIQPTHFPCYNKSYLRFALNSVPAGKVIISATLTLHHWGNANPDAHTDSYVWLSSVTDPWGEMTIHWNNAPLAQENYSMTRIPQVSSFPGWPGIAYSWDASKAVAEAYAAGQPVSFAMYDSTTGRDSSKYLTSSETGIEDDPSYWNWNIEGRPKLTIVWGKAAATINKEVWPAAPTAGQRVTYTLSLLGSGQALTLTDDLPAQVSAPGPIQVTGGPAASYNVGTHRLTWTGSPTSGLSVTITFPVTVTTSVSGSLAVLNTAVMTDTTGSVSTDTALFIVNAYQVWLPIVRR